MPLTVIECDRIEASKCIWVFMPYFIDGFEVDKLIPFVRIPKDGRAS